MTREMRFERTTGEEQRILREALARSAQRARVTGRAASRGARERGAVSVEAILVVLLMMLVFAGVLFVHRISLARQRDSANARACAWAYAGSGCRQMLPNCEEARFANSSDDVLGNLWDEVGDGGLIDATNRLADGSAIESAVYIMIAPVLNALFGGDGFGYSTSPRGIGRPILLGGGEVKVSGSYTLRCNLTELEPLEPLERVWEEMLDATIH